MAQVPYSPIPSVSPADPATPKLSVPALGAAFGTEQGEALGNLGKGIAQAGGELFQRAVALQQLANDAEAKEADADFTIQLGKLHAEYNSLQGKAAVDAYPKYAEDVQALRAQIGERLSSDHARKLYDSASKSMAARTIFNGAGYAATQNKAYLFGASEARVKAGADYFYQNPEADPKEFENTAKVEATQQGAIKGWSPEQTENAAKEYISRAWLNRITGLANTEPFEAKRLLDANRGKLFGDDIRRVEQIVENRGHAAGSRIIVEGIMAPIYANPEGAKEKTREQLMRDAEAEAARRFPNDPLMQAAVRERFEITYNRFKAGRREQINNDRATIEQAVSGRATGVRLFTEEEVINSSPEAAAAWDRLPEPARRAVRQQMVDNSRGRHLENPQNKERFTILMGQSISDPDEFLEATNNGIPNMPDKYADQLWKRRWALLKREGEADPRVMKAMEVIRNTYGEAVPKKSDDPDRYWLLVGSVQEMMINYEQEYRKPMPPEEKRKMAAEFLQQTNPNRWRFLEREKRGFDLVAVGMEKLKERPEHKNKSNEELRALAVRAIYQASRSRAARSKAQDQVAPGSPIGGTAEPISPRPSSRTAREREEEPHRGPVEVVPGQSPKPVFRRGDIPL